MKQKKSLYKLLAEKNEANNIYFKHYLYYAREIKKRIQDLLKDARVFVFGSVVRQDLSPDSDIDILIVSGHIPEDNFERVKIKTKIKQNFLGAPFELHLANIQEYEHWYKNFIKNDFVEI